MPTNNGSAYGADGRPLGAIETLRDLIDTVCKRVSSHPDFYSEVGRGLHAALTGTNWSDRASEWFPKDPLQLPTKTMKRENYDLLVHALCRFKDRRGRRIASDDEVASLDRAFERYEAIEHVTVPASSKDPIQLLKEIDPQISRTALQDCDGFKTFLLHNVYLDIVSGNAALARRKTQLLYLASRKYKGADKIAKNAKEQDYQMQACVALLGFIGYVTEDGTEQIYVDHIAAANDRSPSAFLHARLLTHRAHHVEGSENHIALLRLVQDGLNVEIPTYERVASSSFHNAVRSCVERGMRLEERIPGCNGITLDEAIEKGIEAHAKFGDNDSYVRHEILRIRGHLNAKQFDKSVIKSQELLSRVRERNEEGESMPHLHIRLLQAHSEIFEALAVRGEKHCKAMAIYILHDAIQMARQFKLSNTEKRIKLRLSKLEKHNGA